MGVAAAAMPRTRTASNWLHSRSWDLTFISLSVVLVTCLTWHIWDCCDWPRSSRDWRTPSGRTSTASAGI